MNWWMGRDNFGPWFVGVPDIVFIDVRPRMPLPDLPDFLAMPVRQIRHVISERPPSKRRRRRQRGKGIV